MSKVVRLPTRGQAPALVGAYTVGPETPAQQEELERAWQAVAAAHEEVRRQAEAAVREGYQRGLEEGRAAGEAAVRQEAAAHLRALAELVARARHDREALLLRAEAAVVELALEVARQVLRREVALDRQAVVRTVAAALRSLAAGPATVRVHPSDRATVEAWLQRAGEALADHQLTLTADDEVEPGGCVVEVAEALVDARLRAQLEAVREHFQQVMERAEG